MEIFRPGNLGAILLKNRVFRSATFEGACDEKGFPKNDLKKIYLELAKNEVGAIITGFSYISNQGRAMHPGQAGLENDEKITSFAEITHTIHQCG